MKLRNYERCFVLESLFPKHRDLSKTECQRNAGWLEVAKFSLFPVVFSTIEVACYLKKGL